MAAAGLQTRAPAPTGEPVAVARGWEAALRLQFTRREERTILSARRARGPLVVQKPLYPEGGGVCHIYLIHPPGGVVGGDRLRVEMDLQSRAHVLLTTPGAAKFYRSAGAGVIATQSQDLRVGAEAALEWLPQDSILFSGSRVSMTTTVRLEARARFIGWDITCLGRPASGDGYISGEFNQRCQILREDQPLLIERNRYLPGGDLLRARWGLAGNTVVATLFALPASDEMVALLRDRLPSPDNGIHFAATRVNDVLVFRCLGRAAEPCREMLVRAWELLRPGILQRSACAPRIWRT